MRLVLALLLPLIGLVAGAALGMALRPAAEPPPGEAGAAPDPGGQPAGVADRDAPASYVELSHRLIVPVVEDGRTRALMLFEIALDVPPEHRDAVLEREPRLRDAFLREFFELSHSGVFLRTYTSERVMQDLRERLRAAARVHVGERFNDVLILDALRQELPGEAAAVEPAAR